MLSSDLQKSKSARVLGHSPGFSLMEMVVVLAILSILSSLAIPYARKSMQREKELELRWTLREVRTAIDRFHDDWQGMQGNGFERAASVNGYPRSIEVLIEGVDGIGPDGRPKRYLRRLPRNPFSPNAPFDEQWQVIGYEDDPSRSLGRAKDIYDLRVKMSRTALDGTAYADW